jgi:hypothetical protein
MPDDFGDLAVNTRVHFLLPHAHTRLRVRLAPGIPHALWLEGGKLLVKLALNKRRDREAVFWRHCERSEAIHSYFLCCGLDCFAEPVIGPRFARTRWLAMTVLKPEHTPTLSASGAK